MVIFNSYVKLLEGKNMFFWDSTVSMSCLGAITSSCPMRLAIARCSTGNCLARDVRRHLWNPNQRHSKESHVKHLKLPLSYMKAHHAHIGNVHLCLRHVMFITSSKYVWKFVQHKSDGFSSCSHRFPIKPVLKCGFHLHPPEKNYMDNWNKTTKMFYKR